MQVCAECLPTMRNIPNEKTNMPWVLHPRALPREETVDIENNYNAGDKCRNREWVTHRELITETLGRTCLGIPCLLRVFQTEGTTGGMWRHEAAWGLLGMTNGSWL